MKKKNFLKNNKAKLLMLALPFVVALAMIYFVTDLSQLQMAKKVYKANTEDLAGTVQLASDNNIKVIYPNLIKNNLVYVLSKENALCADYANTTKKGIFGFRCRTLRSLFRGIWTQKIDTKGYGKLRVDARLNFAECGYNGVNSEDAVDLMILSSDPNRELSAECNHHLPQDKWHWCSIDNTDERVMTHCGLDRCSESKNCNMDIDVRGKDEVYMIFRVSDDWFADVEGTLSGVKITLIK